MMRFILLMLLMLLVYIGWKILKIFLRRPLSHSHPSEITNPSTSFDHIQDAEFEDLTPKSPEKPTDGK